MFENHHLHDLRHTFITRAQECGIRREIVSLWAGHKADNTMTSNVYTHFSREYQKAEIMKFDYWFTPNFTPNFWKVCRRKEKKGTKKALISLKIKAFCVSTTKSLKSPRFDRVEEQNDYFRVTLKIVKILFLLNIRTTLLMLHIFH